MKHRHHWGEVHTGIVYRTGLDGPPYSPQYCTRCGEERPVAAGGDEPLSWWRLIWLALGGR